MRGPTVIPELFTVVGNDDDQRVVEESKFLQPGGEQLQIRIVVQDLAVVPVDRPPDEFVGIDAVFPAPLAAYVSAPPYRSFLSRRLA